jgi:(p)ppGpp synthase/HD superfamily hydrolase
MSYSSRFETALAFSARLHGSQIRKVSGVPYISHLLAVTAVAIEHGATEDEAIAALLHDAVEDQGGEPTEQVIRRMFGNAVGDIVHGCSDSFTDSGHEKSPWQERKEKYIADLRHASASIRLISAADKLHNARSVLADYHKMGEKLWTNFKGGREGTLWYYRSLTDIFMELGPKGLAEELDSVVRELERVTSAGAVIPNGPRPSA